MHAPKPANSVLGTELHECGCQPMTGWFRDGHCRTDHRDLGRHVVCARVTAEFLAFSKSKGNDLSTPRPEFNFPGLQPGDHWCLCALRWQEAFDAGVAPPVILQATHERALHFLKLDDLKACAWAH